MACAASPSSSTLPPTCHGAVCTVPSWPCGCCEELRQQIRNERHRIRKLAREEIAAPHPASAAPRSCARRLRQEQRRGEAAIGVRQRDEHEAAARPHVQRVHIERGTPVHRRQREFLVVVVEQLLARVDEAVGREARAHDGARAIGGDGGRQRHVVVIVRFSSRKRSMLSLRDPRRGRSGRNAA